MKGVNYYYDSDNKFVIDDYNWAKPFSNFFPAIAGKWGIPMWCYYVNRNQCVCSLGVDSKDHQIMEFMPFNKALANVGSTGFRTFVKLNGGPVFEPFQKNKNKNIEQKMIVSSGELEIVELNKDVGLEISVLYYPVVNYSTPVFIRKLTVKNMGRKDARIELVDGLPHIIPYGMTYRLVKDGARHHEGMMCVVEKENIPIFKLKQTPADVEEVGKMNGGNFFFSVSGDDFKQPAPNIIVDPKIIFEDSEIYTHPWNLDEKSIKDILGEKQIKANKTPCAFCACELNISGGSQNELYSMVGYVDNDEQISKIKIDFSDRKFFEKKRRENTDTINGIKNFAFTVTNDPLFDEYSKQTFLDNVIRGGMPVVYDSAVGKSAFYIYSRQNGDLERDYHHFVVEPTYMSQGTGHYRSVLQNRRCDSWFFSEVGDCNIKFFMNLTQLDGYNPLEVNRLTYRLSDEKGFSDWVETIAKTENNKADIRKIVLADFSPGEFIMKMEKYGIETEKDNDQIIREMMKFCVENDVGGRHDLGFWVDHWSYNLDTLEVFQTIYPDRIEEAIVKDKGYYFFDNPDRVLPRSEKCVVTKNGVRRYGAIFYDKEKNKIIESREFHKNRVRTKYGRGDIYRTNFLNVLMCHIVNRMATLDPQNIGVEMEANKPGWNDSMSGLPGLFGSSLCHKFELERSIKYLIDFFKKSDLKNISLFEELVKFMKDLGGALERRLISKNPDKCFEYWDETNNHKEAYREKTKLGVSGQEEDIAVSELLAFLRKSHDLLEKVYDENKDLIYDKTGVPYTYLRYEVKNYDPLWKDKEKEIPKKNNKGLRIVRPLKFTASPLAAFLEGPVHYARAKGCLSDDVYDSIKSGDLYDKKLKMYKVCAPLVNDTYEIGRVHAWGPGWIENESIYTHMEYKYLLELIKCGRYEDFFKDIKTCLSCFLDPSVYGRSTIENVSFIVSSAFPDESLHGRGFQPRLSGVTNEMLHIWILMLAGHAPFVIDEKGGLNLKFNPILPGWLFTDKERSLNFYDCNDDQIVLKLEAGCVAFNFLGGCMVVYHNKKRGDTFGNSAVKPEGMKIYYNDGRVENITGGILKENYALDVRGGLIKRIDVELI